MKNNCYDVAVCGGGFAGISAALAAARQGKRVILFEKQYMLGGLATAGLVTIYPILFLIVSFFVARFACRNKETRKVGYFTLLIHFVVVAINLTIIILRILGLN